MESILKVLMNRDDMTQEKAENQIAMAREDLHERLKNGEMPHDICEQHFGLEPDYMWELM